MKLISLLMALGATSFVSGRAIKKRAPGFTWLGANESGAEFGEDNIPGTLDKDYTWPNTTAIQTLRDEGMNIFRVPFLMERLVPGDMTGSVDGDYLRGLKRTVTFITDSGAYAVLDPHNYGRYSGNIITSPENFQTFWKTVAGEFTSNEKVIFDTNNEYHDMDQSLVLHLNQAAITGIRSAGAKTQYIFIEGNAYTGAWKWTSTNTNLASLSDPQGKNNNNDGDDKLVYQMHQYLDADGSGTSAECVSPTIGRERLQDATAWLKKNGKRGVLGEFAGGVNQQCQEAVRGMLEYMSQNSEVWMGASWWAAGPWWGDYMYNLEPTDGKAYGDYLPILRDYFVSSSSSSSSSFSAPSSSLAPSLASSSSASLSSAVGSRSMVIRTPAPAPAPAAASSTRGSSTGQKPTIPVSVPTLATSSGSASPSSASVSVSAAPSASASASASGSGSVHKYGQCGGMTWTGPTACDRGSSCVKQNAYYSQCQ